MDYFYPSKQIRYTMCTQYRQKYEHMIMSYCIINQVWKNILKIIAVSFL